MSQAQDLALAALGKRRGLIDDAAIARAKGEKGPLLGALLKVGAVSQAAIADLLGELVKTRFRCAACGVDLKYEALVRFEALECERCRAPLETVEPRTRKRSGLPRMLVTPERLGAYKIGSVLGRGSMGVVYEARKEGDERLYALKVMKPDDDDPTTLARFSREAEVASRLEHANIVRVLDRGEQDGDFYYVMEHCPGPTLQARLLEGPLAPLEAARLVRDLASAAAAAHASGVIHRDLKPANVILEKPSGRPRVTDFGLARDALSAEALTRSGDMIGTPYYMAPEQVRAEKNVDGRADVYALGVMLFECLSAKRPFEGRSPAELGRLIVAGARKSLRELAPGVPVGLEAIAMKAFSLRREDRYDSAGLLRDDLDRWLKGITPRALGKEDARERAAPPLKVLAWSVALLVFATGMVVHLVRRWTSSAASASQGSAVEKPISAEEKKKQEERARRDADEALAAAEKAARDKKPEALGAWRVAHARGGGAPRIELGYARFLLRRNHAAESASVLKPLIASGTLTGAAVHEARSAFADALLRQRPPGLAAAREELAKLATDDPDGARGRLAHARLALLDGREDEARRAVEDSIAAEELAPAHALLARLLASGYEPAKALPRYAREATDRAERSRADERVALALRHANRAIALSPDDVEAITARSEVRVHLQVNRFYAHADFPSDSEYLELMRERRRDLDEAIELALGQPEARALALRGRYLFFFSQDGSPAEDLDAALALDGRDIEALVLRALAAERDGGDAVAWMKRALDQDERAAFAVARHFQIFKSAAASELAFRAAAARRKERAADFERAHVARLDARLARASARARDALRDGIERARAGEPTEDVIGAFARATQLAPTDPVPLLELARVLIGRERTTEALAAVEKARGLGGDPVEVSALRGEALLRAGRTAEAKDDLADAERRAEGAKKLLAAAALARASGDSMAAREAAGRAVLAAPDDPSARMAFAAALLDGDAPEPDAACAEALWALELDGRTDAEATHLAFLGRALGGVLVPHPEPDMIDAAKETLAQGWRQLDRLVPCARLHARAGAAFLRAPSEAARAIGRGELDAARKGE